MNQDHLGWMADLGLFVVADGMGGHNAGEVASHLAVETIHGFIAESAASGDITWPFGLEVKDSIETESTDDRRAAGEPQDLRARAARSPELNGMGTTVVAALVGRRSHHAGVSVGDSRIYRFRDGALEQLTKDDTWLASVLGAEAGRDAIRTIRSGTC